MHHLHPLAQHLTLGQAVFLGVLQGFSELFPISSLGHIIMIKALLHWHFNTHNRHFLSFIVALHLATATALVIYFWKPWWRVLRAYLGSLRRRQFVYDEASKLAWLLVAGTIIVGLVGLLLEKKFRLFFDNPAYLPLVAVFLILNGAVLALGDYLKKRSLRQAAQPKPRRIEELSFPVAAAVGGFQTLALFPGISRSGAAMVGGILAGLSYEEACRFAFMLATPVIGAAGLLKVPALFAPSARAILHLTLPAALAAGVVAYLSTAFLMRYFKTNRLWPFAIYCVLLGAGTLALWHG